ncbi:MAG: ETC complex I subunit [Proteobacteria bacterium]|nr:ETC complex I subunit [Pseudomonadota bacterium]MDZ3835871.1 ETC complex I subunit [Rhodospirillales bacterium]
MAVVRIYQPARTAMQSGLRKTRQWLLEFEAEAPTVLDPLMGWNGSADTRRQIRLEFDSCEDAVAYAERNGLRYRLSPPHHHRIRPKSYAENFSPSRVR